MPGIPAEPPERCPVCDTAYESVSEHEDGLMIALNDNDLYKRVCVEPKEGDDESGLLFYHHTHDQATAD